MRIIVKKSLKHFLRILKRAVNLIAPLHYRVVLLIGNASEQERKELIRRFREYCPGEQLPLIKHHLSLRDAFSESHVLSFDTEDIPLVLRKIKSSPVFCVNPSKNQDEAWNWFSFVQQYYGLPDLYRRSDSVRKLKERIAELQKLNFEKVYLFGTGTSLEKAMNIDFRDGCRVVCNTIVKDKDLWHHLEPHIIVAGDAIYHFGPDDYAKAFRHDLRERLSESETCFVYPELFDSLVAREFADFDDRLIPVPFGTHKGICCNLIERFELPDLGNILNVLLLPLGCTLSANIYLWGFDGRAPDDKFFWSNSDKHFYQEHFQALIDAHPAFFEHHVPKDDPSQYVRSVFGDYLNQQLSIAEQNGMKFEMMHSSWTPTLNKRFTVKTDNASH
jgi:hypothetical protein